MKYFLFLENLKLEEKMENVENINSQQNLSLEELKSNQEDINLDMESIDNSLLDLTIDENFSISFNIENIDESRAQEDKINFEEMDINSENISDDYGNAMNIDKIKKRNFLNIFILEASKYKNQLKNILLSEEQKNLNNIEDKILKINLDKKDKQKEN